MKAKEAYQEIFEVLNKHKDICVFDINDMERKSKYHLFGLQLKEDFGLNIDPKKIQSLDWMSLGEYTKIGRFGKKYSRTISWSDDGTQPDDELLLHISFSTGPYMFGEDYPVELYKKFWLELVAFNPKYKDTVNNGLYFSMENAKDVFNSFNDILNKYRELNKADFKLRKIAKMKEELAKLEASQG